MLRYRVLQEVWRWLQLHELREVDCECHHYFCPRRQQILRHACWAVLLSPFAAALFTQLTLLLFLIGRVWLLLLHVRIRVGSGPSTL